MSQDIFQMWMDDIIAQCPGVLGIHDDVFIYSKDDNDHDANLVNLFNVAQKEGMVFNSTKCAIKARVCNLFWWRDIQPKATHLTQVRSKA